MRLPPRCRAPPLPLRVSPVAVAHESFVIQTAAAAPSHSQGARPSVRRPSSSVTGRSRFRVNLNGEKALEKLGTRKMAKGRGGHCRSREGGTTRPSLRPRNSAGTGYSSAAEVTRGAVARRRASTARGGRRGRAGREQRWQRDKCASGLSSSSSSVRAPHSLATSTEPTAPPAILFPRAEVFSHLRAILLLLPPRIIPPTRLSIFPSVARTRRGEGAAEAETAAVPWE